MSLKQKLRSLERKMTDGRQRWVTKLADDLGNVIRAPRAPRDAEVCTRATSAESTSERSEGRVRYGSQPLAALRHASGISGAADDVTASERWTCPGPVCILIVRQEHTVRW